MGSERAPARDGYRYPLHRRNDRRLPAEWRGELYLWDIDNTYLVTEWEGLRDLIRIRFESAQDKRPVPGAVELLAALRRVPPGADEDARPPIYFVSASPETMREVLEKRMLIDGVMHDGISFRNLKKLRYLRDIFGYKVAALLLYRLENPRGARETLFGDDREHDPWIYTLYARICAGAIRGEELREHLLAQGTRKSAARYITTLADELPEHDPVERVFIRRLQPGAAEPAATEAGELDPRIVFVDDYAQAGAVLHAQDRIDTTSLQAIVQAVRAAGLGADPLSVAQGVSDLPAAGLAATAAALEGLPGAARPELAEEGSA